MPFSIFKSKMIFLKSHRLRKFLKCHFWFWNWKLFLVNCRCFYHWDMHKIFLACVGVPLADELAGSFCRGKGNGYSQVRFVNKKKRSCGGRSKVPFHFFGSLISGHKNPIVKSNYTLCSRFVQPLMLYLCNKLV